MTLLEFFETQLDGVSDPVLFALLSFMIMFIGIDVVHIFMTSISTWFRNK